MYKLKYNKRKWRELPPKPCNTIQIFITNRCNLRCPECFYRNQLGGDMMNFNQYKEYVMEYKDKARLDKITLNGGEPTTHKDIERMIEFNRENGLRTTIYTNGTNLKRFEDINLEGVAIRVSVCGINESEKPLSKVPRTSVPITMNYMLRKDNVEGLMEAAKITENEFNCKGLFINHLRDITATGNFWEDTDATLSIEDFYQVVQNFVDEYDGKIPKLHIPTRGVIETDMKRDPVIRCRFGNIFPDGTKVICIWDISIHKTSKDLVFNKRRCNKNRECLLQKIVLERR